MAPLLFKEMKGVNFSCTSPASAAVCSSIDRRSIVHPTIISRSKSLTHQPKASSKPKPYSENNRTSLDHRLSSTRFINTSTSDLTSPGNSSRFLLDDDDDDATLFYVYNGSEPSLSLTSSDSKLSLPRLNFQPMKENGSSLNVVRASSFDARNDHRMLVATPRLLQPLKGGISSSAVLISSAVAKSHHKQVLIDTPRILQPLKGSVSSSAVLKSSSSAKSHHDQVVVLRVSLHCKGCEGKVRKHISKMEGVTSFNIDFAAKKVTVMGDVTPLGVLNSVSKVKNAQFWSSPPRASTSF